MYSLLLSINVNRHFFILLFLCFYFVQAFSSDILIDIYWNGFNTNQYDGLLFLPQDNDGNFESIGGFTKKTSKDGHVVVGYKEESVISSLNSLHWKISNPKNGVYKLYLFCIAGKNSEGKHWTEDVKVHVTVDGIKTIFTPNKENGEVWEILHIDGISREIMENQTFYPFRHLIYGYTRDALTGKNISGVKVSLLNSSSGKKVAGQESFSDADGFFGLYGFPLGRYSVQFELDSYIPIIQKCDFMLVDLPRRINPVLSPKLNEAQIRVTLEWGVSPADLDAHLLGPGPENEDSFHISYNHMHEYEYRHFLDIDDTDSYGPETITIGGLDGGIYTYSIHDFSNRDNLSNSFSLARSQAIVRIYMGNSMIKQFFIPEKEGNMWRVFQIDGTTAEIISINEVMYIDSSDNVY